MTRRASRISSYLLSTSSKKQSLQFGFTIVELLIVIVIIGILATLAIVAYSGVAHSAREAAVKSETGQISRSLAAYSAVNGSYPADATTAGAKTGGGRLLDYGVSTDGARYCATVSDGDIAYHASWSNSVPQPGACQWIVTTLAGSGTVGSADGAGTVAQFDTPYGVAVDTSGYVYVSDYGTHRIRKITPGGVVTTLAGASTGSFADGTGSSARFNRPVGASVDTLGNVYVSDINNQRIRKITPGGVVTTLAGSGVVGADDGINSSAQFNMPVGVAVDTSGNVYVADRFNHIIRKITLGIVSTIAGLHASDFAAAPTRFNNPLSIAVDGSGNLYVGDQINHSIRKITPPY